MSFSSLKKIKSKHKKNKIIRKLKKYTNKYKYTQIRNINIIILHCKNIKKITKTYIDKIKQ